MKKLSLLGIACLSILVLAACGEKSNQSSKNSSSSTSQSQSSSSHDKSYYENQEKDSLKNLKTLVENGALSNDDAKKMFQKEQLDDAKHGYKSTLSWVDINDKSSEDTSTSNLKIGNTATTESGNEITVTAITENAQVELDDAKNGETALEVDLTLTNKGNDSQYFNPSDPSVFDSQSNTLNLDSATYGNDIPDIAPGITAKIKLYYDNPGTGPYKVTYGNAVWSN
ncbi:DUF4352 domain-containing protein [Lactococcus lactis subsp. lactis]|uniref:DUF4352 domain-containing protein n=1 Tax=Lactococcus lactis TaxID=1358 RepID=UPI00223B4E34|nr:DUF4352 domain-containing protein [Lactococcus lactis]MCT0055913.1 DUF4352 domain-containing protein [Lactococcus lactis subsp. lactis]